MKYSRTILTTCCLTALIVVAIEIRGEKRAAGPPQGEVISVENLYPEKICPEELCVYFHADPGDDVCQKLDQNEIKFRLQSPATWSQIQRIVLRGKDLEANNAQIDCVAYEQDDSVQLSSLKKVNHPVVEVNYVGGGHMVCSLKN